VIQHVFELKVITEPYSDELVWHPAVADLILFSKDILDVGDESTRIALFAQFGNLALVLRGFLAIALCDKAL